MISPTGHGLGFLLGLPRSGTTLLSVMLDRHPAIFSPPEPWIMIALQALGKVDVRHPVNPQSLAKAVGDFTAGGRDVTMARAAAAALYGGWLEGTGKPFFLDKTPRYHLYADYIARVFPDARYVWLRRDPLDIAASYRTTWDCDLPGLLAADADDPAVFDLLIGLDRLEAFHAALGDRVLVVHYERLVQDPAGELPRILDHLGHPAPPGVVERMTEIGGLERTTGQFGDHKILDTREPHTRSVGAWRTVFGPGQWRTLLEAVGSERLVRLGYGDTVAELKRLGVRDSGPELAAHYLARAERHLESRLADIGRVTTFNAPLPGDVQRRAHAALAGDQEWGALLAELSGVRAAAERERAAAAEKERATLATLNGKLSQSLRAMTEEVERLRASEAEARRLCRAAEGEAGRLRAVLAERERAIDALLGSTSWRLMAPLRQVAAWLRAR